MRTALSTLTRRLAILAAGHARLQRMALTRRWEAWLGQAVAEEEQELEEVIHPEHGRGRDVASREHSTSRSPSPSRAASWCSSFAGAAARRRAPPLSSELVTFPRESPVGSRREMRRAARVEPHPPSGRQERLEELVNTYL